MNYQEMKWERHEIRNTKQIAAELKISTAKAYKLCCAEAEAGRLDRYGYRVRDGWEDARNSKLRAQSLYWQYCP